MIVVKVELHSAITGEVTNLATAIIDNIGGTKQRGNYRARAYRKGTWERYARYIHPRQGWAMVRDARPQRTGHVDNHPRLSAPVWSLVRKALESMGY